MKGKRLTKVTLAALTAISFAVALLGFGSNTPNPFTLVDWLILGLETELGLFAFVLTMLGIIFGYVWATNEDEGKSFYSFTKEIVNKFYYD